MTNASNSPSPDLHTTSTSKPWTARIFIVIIAVAAGLFLSFLPVALEPTTAHDATVVSVSSSETNRFLRGQRTTWTIRLRLDDGRVVTTGAASLGESTRRGDPVEIELTDFSDKVSTASWPGGEFSQSRAVALFVSLPMAVCCGFLLQGVLKKRLSEDRRVAIFESGLGAAAFAIALAWPYLP